MKYILLITILLMGTLAFSQTRGKAKLYAFVQPVAPGVRQGTDDINGGEVSTGKAAGQNYLLYISSASRVYPAVLWIDGTAYAVSMQAVSKTPVALGGRTLVPKTANKVWQLTPVPMTAGKEERGKKLAKTNKAVLVYKQSGKFYYAALPELAMLEPAAMQ